MKYKRRKTEMVDAEQWFEDKPHPKVIFPAFRIKGVIPISRYRRDHVGVAVSTYGNIMYHGWDWEPKLKTEHVARYFRYFEVENGDWIVTTRLGEVLVFKPDEFAEQFIECKEGDI